jgi:hypothetical protein
MKLTKNMVKNINQLVTNDGLRKKLQSAQMPLAPNSYKRSFLYLPSTGMTITPDEFILELFREVYFDNHRESIKVDGRSYTKALPLDPELEVIRKSDFEYIEYTKREKAVLEIFRTRKKRFSSNYNFIPAYPELARNGWIRNKSERIIKNLFFRDLISQALYDIDPHKWNQTCREFSEHFVTSILGVHDQQDDILRLMIRDSEVELNIENAIDQVYRYIHLSTSTEKSDEDLIEEYNFLLYQDGKDPLAERIVNDLRSLLELGKRIPRLEWIHLLTGFLRLIIPIWALAKTRLTAIFHEELFMILDQDKTFNEVEFINKVKNRHEKIFVCGDFPNDGGERIITEYGKARTEISLFMILLEQLYPNIFENKELGLTGRSNKLPVKDFFIEISKLKQELREKINLGNLTFKSYFIRNSETYGSWKNPLSKGITKNLHELLRVLWINPDNDRDETGLLQLVKEKNRNIGFISFPRPTLTKMFCYFAKMNFRGNRLLIEDVEKHFYNYGIDLTSSDSARDMLIKQMLNDGMLTGTTDAGKSATVKSYY